MKKIFLSVLTVIMLLSLCYAAAFCEEIKYTYNIPDIKPTEGHPRVYITAEDISVLKQKETDPVTAASWRKLCELADKEISGVLGKVSEEETNYNSGMLDIIKAKALMYVMYPGENISYGRQAVSCMTAYLQTISFCNPSFEGETRQMGHVMETAAIVYDWCYPLMTEKNYYITRFKEISALKEIGWPPEKGNPISSHAGEEEIFRDLLTAGISCYDENPEIYNRAAGRYFDVMAPAREFYLKSQGVHPQGTSYGLMRGQWEALSVNIFDAMGHKDVMGENMKTLPYWNIYARRPDGQWLTDGDDYMLSQAKHFEYKTLDYMLLMLNGNLYKDPYLCSLWLKEYAMSDYSKLDFYTFLFYNPEITTKSINSLPLVRYFGFPHSRITARTSWQNGLDSKTAIADFNLKNIYNDNGTHLDVGSFQIYYKGALALDAGNYEGKDSRWGKKPHFNYYMRTVSHNAMLVYNENEKIPKFWWTTVINDGGQRIPNMTETLAQLKGEDNILSEEISCDIGPDESNPDYAYIKTDLTKAYTEKVSAYDRSFVYLNLFDEDYPMAVIVYDNLTSSDKSYKKSWLLHSIEEPEIEDNVTTIKRTENGYNGKLVNTTFLPEKDNINIEKIGGEGYEAWVDGVNYHNRPFDRYDGAEPGNWRIEISPETEAENDVFINAMYVTDADNEKKLEVKKRDMGNFVGVEIKDRVVLLSKNSQLCSDEINISIEGNKSDNFYYLVTDVSAGLWKIEGEGKAIYAEALEGENTLYFYAPPGDYTLTKINSMSVQLQSFQPREKEVIGDFDVFNHTTGLYLYLDNPAKLIGNTAYLPLSLMDDLGIEAEYSPESGEISLKHKNNAVTLRLQSNSAETVFAQRLMENTPVLINEIPYLPMEDVSPMLGIYAKYDSISRNLFVKYNGIISGNCAGEYIPVGTKAKIDINMDSAPEYESLWLNVIDDTGDCNTYNIENGAKEFLFEIPASSDYVIYVQLVDRHGVICKSDELLIHGYDFSAGAQTLVSQNFDTGLPTSIYAYNGEDATLEIVDSKHGKSVKLTNNSSSTEENSLFVYKNVKSGLARFSAEVYFSDFSEKRYVGIYSSSKNSFQVFIDKQGNITIDEKEFGKIETEKWYKFDFIYDFSGKKCIFLIDDIPVAFCDINLENLSRFAIFNSAAGRGGTIYIDNINIYNSTSLNLPVINTVTAYVNGVEYVKGNSSGISLAAGEITLRVKLAGRGYEGKALLIATLHENGAVTSCDVESTEFTPYISKNINLSLGKAIGSGEAEVLVRLWDKGLKSFDKISIK